MRRRFLLTSMGATILSPGAAWAQEPGRTYRLGALFVFPPGDPARISMLEGLAITGFVEGKNLIVDQRGFAPHQFPTAARELVQAKVDVLAAGGGEAIKAAQSASNTIPIVAFADDMVQEGHVESLANRTGNTTGISILATELDGKRLETLMELLPTARRLAVLADARLLTPAQVEKLESAARLKNVELSIVRIEKPEDIAPALAAARTAGAEGVNILGSPLLFSARRKMFAITTALHLPTVYQWPEGVTEGALVAYGPRYDDTFRQWGRMAGKVLRGAKPSELPVEQPAKFELAINMKTAKALGVTIPPSILARADKVIE
ncbi:MAG: ABC transporter substrate-binding protein [Reyranellales bacterium]